MIHLRESFAIPAFVASNFTAPLTLLVGAAGGVWVTLRRPDPTEQAAPGAPVGSGYAPGDLLASATCSVGVSASILDELEGRGAPQSKPALRPAQGPTPTIHALYRGPLVVFPIHPIGSASPELTAVRTEWSARLLGATRHAIDVVLWRSGHCPDPGRMATSGLEWSRDGNAWARVPPYFYAGGEQRTSLLRDEAQEADIAAMLANLTAAPIGHAMFRDAWNQRGTNPRAALMLGVAAVEIGFKQLVVDLVPAAAYLAMHAPTPPLVKLLKHSLPQLPVRSAVPAAAPPKSVLSALATATELRNGSTHSDDPVPPPREVEALLLALRDILWLYDFYAGRAWAAQHLRPETRAALHAPGPR